MSLRMKRSFALLFLAFAAATAHAGSFGGPPPFSNGSPLTTGTDGVYQAVASGTNLTGVFSWQISSGVQTAGLQNNSWVFFVDGQILSGTTAVNVSQDKVAGVLDAGLGSGVPTNDNGTVDLPLVFVIPGNAGAGMFNGKINLNSPIAYFHGTGRLSGTPARVDQIVFIQDDPIAPVTVVPITIPGSTLGNIDFEFRGSRLSTTVSTSSSTTN